MTRPALSSKENQARLAAYEAGTINKATVQQMADAVGIKRDAYYAWMKRHKLKSHNPGYIPRAAKILKARAKYTRTRHEEAVVNRFMATLTKCADLSKEPLTAVNISKFMEEYRK